MQPYHVVDDGAGPRVASLNADCMLIVPYSIPAGKVAFGSDWPVAPLSALDGIYAAVNRGMLDGKNPNGWFPPVDKRSGGD